VNGLQKTGFHWPDHEKGIIIGDDDAVLSVALNAEWLGAIQSNEWTNRVLPP